jgi:RNA polymerase sigma factor (sigma-70 family)
MPIYQCPSCGRPSAVPIDPRTARLCLYKERRDKSAITQVIDLIEDGLWSFAQGVCRRKYLPAYVAEEAVQDTILQIMRNPDTFRCPGSAVGYLKAIARNKIYDTGRAMRRESHRTKHVCADDDDEPSYTSNHEIESPRQYEPPMVISSREALAQINQFMDALPETDRYILHQRMSGRSPGQIAERLGFAYTAVTARLHRIRERFRKEFDESDEDCA